MAAKRSRASAAAATVAAVVSLGGVRLAAAQVETLPPPASPAAQPAWLANITAWRATTLAAVGYNGSIYDTYLPWTNNAFVMPQVMMHDSYLYDAAAGMYTVPKFLADLNTRYGGVQGVLLWHSYPNIGIDDRNQFTKLLDLPGGLAGLQKLVADFHAAGVYVGFPLNPWDTCTNYGPGQLAFNVTLPALWASIVRACCVACVGAGCTGGSNNIILRHTRTTLCRAPTFSTATPCRSLTARFGRRRWRTATRWAYSPRSARNRTRWHGPRWGGAYSMRIGAVLRCCAPTTTPPPQPPLQGLLGHEW